VVCHVEVVPGPPVRWARLVGPGEDHSVGRNRNLVGRLATADVSLPHDDVSRRHAMLWREGGRIFIRDLASSNGTTVDGMRVVGEDPVEVGVGSSVGFGSHRYRFVGP
jgi:pSer/pThr/pTyr-binding forkhead associated (FHA) protein